MVSVSIHKDSETTRWLSVRHNFGTQWYDDRLRVSRKQRSEILGLIQSIDGVSIKLAKARRNRKTGYLAKGRRQAERDVIKVGTKLFKIISGVKSLPNRSLAGVFGNQKDVVLELDESSRDLPWELAYDDDFLCCKYNVGRTLPGGRTRYFSGPYNGTRALVVGLNYAWDPDFELAYPEIEARRVTKLLDRFGFDPIPLYGEEATKEAVMDELREGVAIFHFSGHGSFKRYRKENRQVGLELAEDERLTENDLRDAFETAHGAPDLAFLNACESTPEAYTSSMVDTFFDLGVNHLLGTYWSVYDKPSTDFVVRFYEELTAGATYGESLRLARLQFRKGTGYSHYATWPAFVHYGQPAETLVRHA